MTNFIVDALEAIPEKNSVYALIKSNCSLKYYLNTLKNNINAFKAKFTYHQLFAISVMPEAVFQKYLYEHNIFEIKSQKIMVMFDFSFLSFQVYYITFANRTQELFWLKFISDTN